MKNVLIVADAGDDTPNLNAMIARFSGAFSREPEVVNLRDLFFKGGCQGCLRCGFDNTCLYEGQDEFIDFYRKKVSKADVVIMAGAVVDRYLSWRWKRFFDRSFFNTHQPTLRSKQVGYLISGPLGQLANLREILHAHVECQGGVLLGFVTDESGDSITIDGLLDSMAGRAVAFSRAGYRPPSTFLGVGGMKVLRDDLWAGLKFPFQGDHKHFKAAGLYDFPQKEWKKRLASRCMMLLTALPFMRREIYRKHLKEGMVKPLRKVVDSV
jgi:hypothetical protein